MIVWLLKLVIILLSLAATPTATPEPTATPTPTAEVTYESATATLEPKTDIESLICQRSWPCEEGLKVAHCESRFIATAENGIHRGLFQISKRFHEFRFIKRGLTWEAAFIPFWNIDVAEEIYIESGYSWRQWDEACRP